jgi:hypothetical protein
LFLFPQVAAQIQRNAPPNTGYDKTLSISSPENVRFNPAFPPVEIPALNVRPIPPIKSGTHSIRYLGLRPSGDALRQYLASKHSPLADHAEQILQSNYWSTIVGISAIEQRFCTIRPQASPFNCWGIMRVGGGLARYSSFEESISAIDGLLTRYEGRGYDTLEELNGYYVQPASDNWFRVVTITKAAIEEL